MRAIDPVTSPRSERLPGNSPTKSLYEFITPFQAHFQAYVATTADSKLLGLQNSRSFSQTSQTDQTFNFRPKNLPNYFVLKHPF